MPKREHGWIYYSLVSKKLTIFLFGALAVLLAWTTFMAEKPPILWGAVRFLLVIIAANLSLCTLDRIRYISKQALIIHVGVLLIFSGGLISSFGYVATVNIYEGDAVDRVFRWDTNEYTPLDMEIRVENLNEEYYPIQVKVGVLKGDEKVGLFVLRTGEDFDLEKYKIRVDSLDLRMLNLQLSVFNDSDYIGTADTLGEKTVSEEFPYEFKLVAFRTPVLKRAWLDLRLLRDSEVLAQGTSAVNHPLEWNGISFYHTQTGRDKYGIPYVGIQMTRDPGKLYVYAGFCVITLGLFLYFIRRLKFRRN